MGISGLSTGDRQGIMGLYAACGRAGHAYVLFAGWKQYVVIAAGGHGKLKTKQGDYVVAFALP